MRSIDCTPGITAWCIWLCNPFSLTYWQTWPRWPTLAPFEVRIIAVARRVLTLGSPALANRHCGRDSIALQL
jgi:hypothetical protein